MNRMKKNPSPAIGAHFRISAWRLMFLAAFRYFTDSARKEVERCDMPRVVSWVLMNEAEKAASSDQNSRSRLSPRHSRSSIFFVMILVTSFKLSFS